MINYDLQGPTEQLCEGLALDSVSMLLAWNGVAEDDTQVRRLSAEGINDILKEFLKAETQLPTPKRWLLEESLEIMHDRPNTLSAAQVIRIHIAVQKQFDRIWNQAFGEDL